MGTTSGALPPDRAFLLIVEDSQTQALRLQVLLEENGYRVRHESNGEAALRAIAEGVPDLVLSDVIMPGMTGYELCQRIKAEPRWRRLPVILLTSLSDAKDVIHGLRAHADYFITKPYDDAYLLTQVAYLLAHPLAAEPVPAKPGTLEVTFAGERFTVTSTREQILNLLLSTYENAVRQNRELVQIQLQLEEINQQLKHTLAELERSNNELQQFAYVVSHDLQAPLRSISGYVEIVHGEYGDRLDDEAREMLQGARDNARRMRDLIQDLLAYSRVGSRREEPRDTALSVVVAEALANLSANLKEAGATVTVDDLPTLRVDASQFVQLFQNLIGNAVKFRRDEPPCVVVSARREAANWLLSVADNGIGMDEAHIPQIFEVFQRLHPQGKYPGTGIGLSICKKIVERHNGVIRVQSRPGAGTTFTIVLPAAPA
jgi:signal transduction histidine kinase